MGSISSKSDSKCLTFCNFRPMVHDFCLWYINFEKNFDLSCCFYCCWLSVPIWLDNKRPHNINYLKKVISILLFAANLISERQNLRQIKSSTETVFKWNLFFVYFSMRYSFKNYKMKIRRL